MMQSVKMNTGCVRTALMPMLKMSVARLRNPAVVEKDMENV